MTDYKGNNVDSCYVCLYNPDFSTAYETYSDAEGHYSLDSIAKATMLLPGGIRLKEYPRMNQVEKKDMKRSSGTLECLPTETSGLNIRL